MTWTDGPLLGFDTETTGVDVDRDRVVTAALVRRDASGTHVRTWLIDPGVPIPEAASAIHGISTEHARAHGVAPAGVLDEIAGLLADAVRDGVPVVAYNASFDLCLLEAELRRHGLPTVENRLGGELRPVIDPLVLDRAEDRYRSGKRQLVDLCGVYQVVDTGSLHTADVDVVATLDVLDRIVGRFPHLGDLDLLSLHDYQVTAHRAWAEAFNAWRAERGHTGPGAETSWPSRSTRTAPWPAAARSRTRSLPDLRRYAVRDMSRARDRPRAHDLPILGRVDISSMSYGRSVTTTTPATGTFPTVTSPIPLVTPTLPEQLAHVGSLVRSARRHRGLTQTQLAELLGTSQSAVHRIEQGTQNLSLDMLTRIGAALESPIVTVGAPQHTHLRVQGGVQLSGRLDVNTSKNGAVALLCASLLNRGTTRLRNVARIVEVDRIVDVLRSVGVRATWSTDGRDLEIVVPKDLDLDAIDVDAAVRTRSIIMFFGPLLSQYPTFELPYAGGCDLGSRTVEPHMIALRPFGLNVTATNSRYHATVTTPGSADLAIVLTERGDTVTENALMAAARRDGVTTIRNASPNYMVQDLCFYLELLGVRIEGIGTTTLRVHGKAEIDADVEYAVSEDPVEAMSLLTAGIVTGSQITVGRVPVEFMEIELATLAEMGLRYTLSPEYTAHNGRTRLVDITVHPSDLRAPLDKIHPMPFPGLNIDNLPFFAVIAACATGSTLVHDWVYEGRAIHLTDLTRLGADVRLLDAHRLQVSGPTRWSGAEVSCPPALRPAVVILLAMLAAKGTSVLRNVDIIARGYEQLQERLVELGARIETFRD